jgi:hypothetical protein
VRRHLFGESRSPRLEVIPCCADLDRLSEQRGARDSVRAELGAKDRAILVYVGKFTGWYMEREMVDFFAVARRELPRLLFLVVTQADHLPIVSALERRGIGPSEYRITSAPHREIGRYLAAADLGIAFVRPCFSKISSSPTKIGEYLGAGLPVVSGTGIGDVDELLSTDAVGVLVTAFDRDAYRRAAERARELLDEPTTPERCRALARRRLSLAELGVPRYDRVYRMVAEGASLRSRPR